MKNKFGMKSQLYRDFRWEIEERGKQVAIRTSWIAPQVAIESTLESTLRRFVPDAALELIAMIQGDITRAIVDVCGKLEPVLPAWDGGKQRGVLFVLAAFSHCIHAVSNAHQPAALALF